MTFEQAFETLIGHEGKFQNSPKDRGNWTTGFIGQGENKGTKYGISSMSYPHLDIANLTLEQAKVIYKRDFWSKAGCSSLPGGLAFDVFDTAVNSGVPRAAMLLQEALGVDADGKIGPITRAAIAAESSKAALQARFNGERLQFMTDLGTWPTYGKGWARRIAANLKAIR